MSTLIIYDPEMLGFLEIIKFTIAIQECIKIMLDLVLPALFRISEVVILILGHSVI